MFSNSMEHWYETLCYLPEKIEVKTLKSLVDIFPSRAIDAQVLCVAVQNCWYAVKNICDIATILGN